VKIERKKKRNNCQTKISFSAFCILCIYTWCTFNYWCRSYWLWL